MSIGIGYTQQYAQRFGFKPSELPASLSMALGTGETTPLRIAEAYSVFANGGYKISAYVIDKIYDRPRSSESTDATLNCRRKCSSGD